MTERERFLTRFSAFLEAHGIQRFVPVECCDVGRRHAGGARLRPPPPELWTNIVPTLLYLQDRVRPRFGDRPIDVNSCFRDAAYNRAVGGAPSSLHVAFNAVDFSVRDVALGEVARFIEQDTQAFSGGRVVTCRISPGEETGVGRYPSFVHFDTRGLIGRPAPARWSA